MFAPVAAQSHPAPLTSNGALVVNCCVVFYGEHRQRLKGADSHFSPSQLAIIRTVRIAASKVSWVSLVCLPDADLIEMMHLPSMRPMRATLRFDGSRITHVCRSSFALTSADTSAGVH